MKGISSRPFGTTKNGEPVTELTLVNDAGASVSVLDYGVTLRSIRVPGRDGALHEVLLGYKTLAEYEENGGYLGATVGRYANRIGGARFTLGGREYRLAQNDGQNTLHGGARGFDKYVWSHAVKGGSAVFTRTSPDGEEGFPGNVTLRVRVMFDDSGALTLIYEAKTDRDTPICLTNHAYFNLEGDGSGDVLDHVLTVNAGYYTPVGPDLIPTGGDLPVEGTPLDFRVPKPIGRDIEAAGGYDHNFVLDGRAPVAIVEAPGSGVTLEVFTDLPGMQLYTGGGLSAQQVSKTTGAPYGPYHGFCLETQFFPDSPNHPEFPSSIVCAGEMYRHATIYRFGAR